MVAACSNAALAACPPEKNELHKATVNMVTGEQEETSYRLAAFASGCLGTASPQLAGTKLGLMGSATEEEFGHILRHLETLALQRAQKLSGVASAGETAGGTGGNASADAGGTSCAGCSETFQTALCDACGQPGGDASAIFTRLPRDAHGRADMLRVFGMAPSTTPSSGTDSDVPGISGVFADFVERPLNLPQVDEAARWGAEQGLIDREVSEASWVKDVIAVNTVRAALVHSTSITGHSAPRASVISALSRRCCSRRPALAKSALLALSELAEADGGTTASTAAIEWPSAAPDAFAGCVGAIRGTKVVARLAETTLAVVSKRVARDASFPAAADALVGCVAAEVNIPAPQPPVVALGLRALSTLAQTLSSNTEEGAEASTAGIRALCERVLQSRRLSPAFSDARSVLRALQGPREQQEREHPGPLACHGATCANPPHKLGRAPWQSAPLAAA